MLLPTHPDTAVITAASTGIGSVDARVKRRLVPLVAALALFGGSAADVQESLAASKPGNAALLDRGGKAITAFVNACADGDRNRLQATLVDDAILELPLTEPGTFFVVDAANAAVVCALTGDSAHIASLQLFPAGERAAVASFKQGNQSHLVLIEMRGSRISMLRDFSSDSEQVKRYAAGEQRKSVATESTAWAGDRPWVNAARNGDAQTQAAALLTADAPRAPHVAPRGSNGSTTLRNSAHRPRYRAFCRDVERNNVVDLCGLFWGGEDVNHAAPETGVPARTARRSGTRIPGRSRYATAT